MNQIKQMTSEKLWCNKVSFMYDPSYRSSKWSASRAKLTSSRSNRCFWWLHPTFKSKPSCLARGRHIYQFAKQSSKGGLITEKLSLWLKSKSKVPNHSPQHLLFRWIVLRIVICHLLFWDLNQSEKRSEIKPPLASGLWRHTLLLPLIERRYFLRVMPPPHCTVLQLIHLWWCIMVL